MIKGSKSNNQKLLDDYVLITVTTGSDDCEKFILTLKYLCHACQIWHISLLQYKLISLIRIEQSPFILPGE